MIRTSLLCESAVISHRRRSHSGQKILHIRFSFRIYLGNNLSSNMYSNTISYFPWFLILKLNLCMKNCSKKETIRLLFPTVSSDITSFSILNIIPSYSFRFFILQLPPSFFLALAKVFHRLSQCHRPNQLNRYSHISH